MASQDDQSALPGLECSRFKENCSKDQTTGNERVGLGRDRGKNLEKSSSVPDEQSLDLLDFVESLLSDEAFASPHRVPPAAAPQRGLHQGAAAGEARGQEGD